MLYQRPLDAREAERRAPSPATALLVVALLSLLAAVPMLLVLGNRGLLGAGRIADGANCGQRGIPVRALRDLHQHVRQLR